MEPRLNLMTNEFAARVGRRFAAVSEAIEQSALPRDLQ